ncbi:hypothetical protein [Flavobacterium luteum]|uniref:Uncharacterized protein n=1 Tax=Flavobacterium luteum TaxID=2026654 RepID=A0A7J5A983_9FLAO|nr:hypothetical protein [Flavobacterium luteum]KAB1154124.1 hypothetical protein F6464_13560 [Flavobacterium luteum]
MVNLFFIVSNFAQTTYYSNVSESWNVAVWSIIAIVSVVIVTITSNNINTGAFHRFVDYKTHYKETNNR